MQTILAAAVLIVSLSLIWSGRHHLQFSSYAASVLSVLEVVGFIISVVALGWPGVFLVAAVSIIASLAWSFRLAIKKQSILIGASVQSSELNPEQASEIWDWMGEKKPFAAIRPLVRAELIRTLAIQARNETEIKAMAEPIAALSVVFEIDPIELAPRFDQLLRLYGKPAGASTEVADTLTVATQQSAASFDEMLTAMITAAGGAVETESLEQEKDGPADEDDSLLETTRAVAELQLHEDGAEGVRLNGGPMDGWLVKRDAPSLKPDWHKTWPPGYRGGIKPGRYEVGESGSWADWIED